MGTVSIPSSPAGNTYPTSDGRPMAETDQHRDLMFVLIETLKFYFAQEPRTYVSGNLLLFYERGNRRRHVAPDVFVVKGVDKHPRLNYLLWEEGRAPQLIIELTWSSTRHTDRQRKYRLYQDVLRVREYFLFDPFGDYLEPPLQGYRLRGGLYGTIRALAGRLPSQVLGLHLERDGQELCLWNPATRQRLPTPVAHEAAARQSAEAARQSAEAARQQEAAARQQAEAEAERLRREVAELRRRLGERNNRSTP